MRLKTILLIAIASIGFQVFAQKQNNTNKVLKSNEISFDDILFWVGEGNNKTILIVNWCNPEIAFAWGYCFEEDSVLVSKIIQDIAAADSRIIFTDGGGYIVDITYKDSVYNLGLSGDYWMYNINEGGAVGIETQFVYSNDIVEFGDESCGLSDTDWVYTWDIPILPVSKPNNDVDVHEISIANENVSIYPNPSNQFINIAMQGVKEKLKMSIVDINGKILYSDVFHADKELLKTIHVNYFSKGMYFLRIQGNNLNKTMKIIIY